MRSVFFLLPGARIVADLNGDATKPCVQFSSCVTTKCNTRAISTGAGSQALSRGDDAPVERHEFVRRMCCGNLRDAPAGISER